MPDDRCSFKEASCRRVPRDEADGDASGRRDLAQIDPRFTRVVTQFSAFGTASEKGAISASKLLPPAVTIW